MGRRGWWEGDEKGSGGGYLQDRHVGGTRVQAGGPGIRCSVATQNPRTSTGAPFPTRAHRRGSRGSWRRIPCCEPGTCSRSGNSSAPGCVNKKKEGVEREGGWARRRARRSGAARARPASGTGGTPLTRLAERGIVRAHALSHAPGPEHETASPTQAKKNTRTRATCSCPGPQRRCSARRRSGRSCWCAACGGCRARTSAR